MLVPVLVFDCCERLVGLLLARFCVVKLDVVYFGTADNGFLLLGLEGTPCLEVVDVLLNND
jgi:hypothetical protein